MNETSNSLLAAVRKGSDSRAWDRLIELYTPFMRKIMLRRGIAPSEVEDVLQNALTIVVRRIPDFERQRVGSFRTWLRRITANCLQEYWRAQGRNPQGTGGSKIAAMVNELCDQESDLSRYWDEQHDRFVLLQLLEMVKHEFRSTTFEAFRRLALEGDSVDDVATELGISVNAAFVARSRVLKRLREIGAGLVD